MSTNNIITNINDFYKKYYNFKKNYNIFIKDCYKIPNDNMYIDAFELINNKWVRINKSSWQEYKYIFDWDYFFEKYKRNGYSIDYHSMFNDKIGKFIKRDNQTDYCYVEFIFDDRKVIFRTPLTNIMTNKQYKQKLILNKSKKYNI
jgi:hypothetical protein